MASQDAKNVALEVLETMGKGKKVVLGKIIRKNGYAKRTADNPKTVTETKSYKGIITPIVEAMMAERDAIMKRLPQVRSKAKYRDLIDGSDKMTKNIQLLTGKETEIVKYDVDKELKSKMDESINIYINGH